MSNVDKRVVQMEFDNKQFEKDMQETVKSLRNFENNLNSIGGSGKAFDDISKGLDSVKSNVKGFNLNPVSDAFEKVKVTISGWEMAAMAAITNVVNGAMNAAKNMARSLLTDPISQGFSEYELKMNSIQTMMMGSGASLDEVNKKLDELNTYADKTIYSFSDMTQNIGKFINAGVSLDDSVAAIQGVSNVAAISGANAQEASRAMYNFAQALSSGYVKLIDWKSIENANMATVKFKQELINTAVELGTLVKEGDNYISTTTDLNGKVSDAFNSTKSFNDSLAHQWMTTDVLTTTLKKYTDETTALGKEAFKAATQVKTFTQLMDTLKEAVGSGWAQTWENVFGNFDDAKNLWTSISDVVGGFIDRQSKARNEMLKTWAEMGGRASLIESLKNVFENINGAITPIKEAFQEVFSPLTANKLVSITRGFAALVAKMELTKDEIGEIKETFKSVFSSINNVLSPVRKAWKEAFPIGTLFDFVKKMTSLIGTIVKISSDLFNSATNNGEVIYKIASILFTVLRNSIDILKTIFNITKTTIKILSPVILFVTRIIGYITDLSLSFVHLFTKSKNVTDAFEKFTSAVDKLISPIQNGLLKAFDSLMPYLNKFKDWVENSTKIISDKFAGAIDGVSDVLLSLVGNLDKSDSGLKNVSSSAQNASKNLNGYRSKLGNTIKTIIEAIKKNRIINSIINGISNIFKTIIEYAKKFAQGVNSTLSPIFEKFKNTGALSSFKDIIKSVANAIGDSVKIIIQSAGPAKDALLKLFGANSIVELIQKFVSIFVQLKLGKMAGSIGDFLDKLAEKDGLLDSIRNAFTSFIEGIKKPLDGFKKKGSIFKSFATSVLMIAASLYLVSKIPTEKLKTTVLALIKVVGLLTVFTAALEFVTKKNENTAKNFAAMALLIASFAKVVQSLLITMAIVSLVIDKVKPESVGLAIAIVSAIGLLITAFTAVFLVIKKSNIDAKQILAYSLLMKAIGSAIKSIALVIAVLSLPIFKPENVKTAGLVVGIISAILMVGLIQLFAKGSQYGMKASQILAMSMLMKVISLAIKSIALVIAILSLPIFDPSRLKNATNIVINISLILGGLILLTKFVDGSNSSVKKFLALSLFIKVVSSAIKSIALVIAILSLPIFDPAKLHDVIDIVRDISLILGGLMLFTKLVDGNNAQKASKSILLMATSIAIISLAIIKLSKVHIVETLAILAALTMSFTILSGVLVGLSFFADRIVTLGKAFLYFGIAAASFGAGVYLIAKAVKTMNKLGPQGIQTMTDMITALVSNLPKWIAMLISGAVDAISKMVPSIARSLVNLLVEVINVMTESATTIVGGIIKLFKAIAKALASLSGEFDIKDLFWSVQAIALIAGLIYVLQVIASDMKSALKGIALMALILGALVGALVIINQFTNPDKSIDILKGVAVALISFAGVMAVIAGITLAFEKFGKSDSIPLGGALKVILIFAAALIILTAAVGVIGLLGAGLEEIGGDIEGTFNNAIKIMQLTGKAFGELMGAIVSSFANLVNNQSIEILLTLVPLILALEPLIAALPILGALFLALGSVFASIPFSKQMLELVVNEILPILAEGLGTFLGILVKKVLEIATGAIIDSMIAFAKGLGRFMDELQPFLNAVQQINGSTLEKVGILALVILEMVATEFISGIASFLSIFTGGKISFIAFAIELAAIAPYLVEFSKTLEQGNFNADLVQKAANATAMLANVANNLPRSGGIFKFFTGTTMSMEDFGSKLEGLGSSLVKFGREVNQLTPDQVKSIGIAAEAVKSLSDVANNMPKEDGVWQRIVGETTDMDEFGNQLEGLGSSLVKFARSVSNISSKEIEAVNNTIPIVKSLVEISNSMPSSGGVWRKIVGESMDLDEFGDKLGSLGSGFAAFSNSISTITTKNMEKAEASVGICKSLVEISNALAENKTGGLAKWFKGDSKEDISSWGEKLPALGSGFAAFAKEVKNVKNLDNVSILADAIKALSEAFQNTSKKGEFSEYFLGRLGDLIHGNGPYKGLSDWKSLKNALGNSDKDAKSAATRIKYVGDAIKALSEAFQNTSDSGAFSGTFLGRLGDLLHGNKGYKEGDLKIVANMLGNTNDEAEKAWKRIEAVSKAIKALSEVFQATSNSGALAGTFLDRVGSLARGNGNDYHSGDLLLAANLLGDKNTDVQNAVDRISGISRAIKALSEVFQATSESGALAGTFLDRVGCLVNGNGNDYHSGDLLLAANLLGTDNGEVQNAVDRISGISRAVKALYEVFQTASDVDEISDTFFSNIGSLLHGNKGSYEDGDILKLSNMLGTTKDEVDATKERIVSVSEAMKAIIGLMNMEAADSYFIGTTLERVGSFLHGNNGAYKQGDLEALSKMLGDNKDDAIAAKDRINAVKDAMTAVVNLMNMKAEDSYFIGTTLERVGTFVHGDGKKYKSGDLVKISNILGVRNSVVQARLNRINAVSSAMTAIINMMNLPAPNNENFINYTLNHLGKFANGGFSGNYYTTNDLITISGMLGQNPSTTLEQIKLVSEAMTTLTNMMNIYATGSDFISYTLNRLGSFANGTGSHTTDDLLIISKMLDPNASKATSKDSLERIKTVSEAMTTLIEVFKKDAPGTSAIYDFMALVGYLANGKEDYKFGDLVKVANLLDENGNNENTEAAYKRISRVALAITELSTAFKDASDVDDEKFTNFTNAVNSLATISIDTINADFADRSKEVLNAASQMIFDLGKTFIDKKDPLVGNVKTLLSAVTEGVSASKPLAKLDFQDFIRTCLNSISPFNSTDPSKSGTFYKAGRSSVDGYVQGIKSKLGDVVNAGNSIGNEGLRGTQQAIDSHSPSREYGKLGYYSILGFVNEIKNKAYMAFDAGENIGQNALNGTKGIIAKIDNIINSEMTLQPVISPILDMSNISSQSQRINGILTAGSTIGMANQASNLIQQGREIRFNASISQNESPDVVEAIAGLTDRMDSLEEAIINRPIMLDKTVVSKELTPEIDKNLGRRAYYSRRGN